MKAIICALTILTLLISYPQNMCINSGLIVENKILVKEKVINNKYKYLNEDIKIPQIESNFGKELDEKINSVIRNDIEPMVNENEKIAKEYFGNINENLLYPYEMSSKYYETLNNDNLLSLYVDYYEFMGGAHGITTRYSYNIDKKNLEILKLKDLFNENYNYKNKINEIIRKKISENTEMYFDNGTEFKGISDNENYYLNKENLIIYYQVYELAPYAAGIIEFKVPMNELKDGFKF